MKEKVKKHGHRFAEVAVEMGYITKEQAKAALMEQLDDNINNNMHRLIGRILLEKGWMTSNEIFQVVNALYIK